MLLRGSISVIWLSGILRPVGIYMTINLSTNNYFNEYVISLYLNVYRSSNLSCSIFVEVSNIEQTNKQI